jgi:hypothetical protein
MYPLEWFDSLIVNTFNPHTDSISSISEYDLKVLCDNIISESQKIKVQIKVEVFELKSKRQIRLLVRKYHSSFVFLLDSIMESRKDERFIPSDLVKIYDEIVTALNDLLSFVEVRFSNFLSLDERVPITYILVSQKELKLKMIKLKTKVISSATDEKTLQIVISNLNQLLQLTKGFKSTYRQLLYQKELLKKIEELDLSKEKTIFYSVFDELLIASNFNSLDYIHSLCAKIDDNLKSMPNLQERMIELLFYFKELRQLHSSEKLSFDPYQKNIKDILFDWFKHEIDYLQSKMELSSETNVQVEPKFVNKNEVVQNKIECVLSTDQIGLILRAGDESRILKARSMSQVFKTIVPHLSTPQKKDLSYESMRSKSYTVEERDKEIAIKTLERIIKHIKDY